MRDSYVLIVEDDDDLRELLGAVLDTEEIAAVGVEHGEAALSYLRSARLLPAVILLDLMMPIMDGWELTAALRKDPSLSHLPLVAMSANHSTPSNLGWRAAFGKPLPLAALISTLRSFLSADLPSPTGLGASAPAHVYH